MTEREDTALIQRYAASRDPALREAIILRYVPLVHYVLGRLGVLRQASAEYEDLVSAGLLGLIDAVDRFDATRGTRFSTYAALRIRGQVLDYLRSQDWLPRGARQRARAAQQAVNTLWAELGRAPTEQEIASHMELDLAKLRQALTDASHMILSLDEAGVTEEEASLHEVLPDEDQPDPAQALLEKELQMRLIEALKELPEREQHILALYYYEGLTMKEIGAVFGVSESRICQIHAAAVMTLRAILQDKARPSNGRQRERRSPHFGDVRSLSQEIGRP